MKPLRIAILTNDYPPHARGGAGVIAQIQAQELERRGHSIRVFEYSPQFLSCSGPIRFILHLRDLWSRSLIVQEIFTWKPDVLITHNLTGVGIGTPRLIQAHGIRWVHILHDVQLVEPSGQIMTHESFVFLRTWWRQGWAMLRRISLGSPNVVISPTKWLLTFYGQFGFFQFSEKNVVPNPLPILHNNFNILRGPKGKDVDPSSILYVGRLDVDKGVDVLLRAWRSMKDNRPVLVLVGDGALRSGLERESVQDVRLHVVGSESHDRVLERMAHSSIVVVPSLVYENQPTVILEALACGCRVVATDVGGIPETLGKAGWVVPAGNVDSLRDALHEACQIHVVREPQEQERRRILRKHELKTIMDQIEKMLL